MKMLTVIEKTRDNLKHLALAAALGVGLGAGSAQAITYANWTLSDGTGNDSGPNGHNLGGGGPVIPSPANWGPSANCTSHGQGLGDFQTWPDTSGWGLPTDDFTLGLWVKASHPSYTAADRSSLFATNGDEGNSLWIGSRKVDDSKDEWVVIVGGYGGTLLANFDVTPDTAQHIEVTREAGKYSVWLDNVLVAEPPTTTGFSWGYAHVGINSGGGTGYSGLFGDITVTDPVAHSPEAKIRTLGLPGMPAVINQTDKTIDWTVTYVSDPKHLAAEFTISDGATAYRTNPGLASPIVITSGTERDFTAPVHYWVQSSTGDINDYTVTVHHTPISTDKDITSFSCLGIPGTIDGTNISQNVPFGADLMTLAPEYTVSLYFGGSATGSPATGVAPGFTGTPPTATYTITAQDGSKQSYTVTLTVLPEAPVTINMAYNNTMNGTASWEQKGSAATQVAPLAYTGTTWNDGGNGSPATSDLLDSVGNPTGFGVSKVLRNVGTFGSLGTMGGNKLVSGSLGFGAWAAGDSAIQNDFQDIFTFSGLDPSHAYNIAFADPCVDRGATYKYGTQTSHSNDSGTATDWVLGQNYALLSDCIPGADGAMTIKMVVAGNDWAPLSGWQLLDNGVRMTLNPEALIYSFEFPGLGAAIIAGTNITKTVPYGTALTLAPTLVASAGATVDPGSGSGQDFSSTVPYIVTSEDGKTTTTYNVTVTVAPPPIVFGPTGTGTLKFDALPSKSEWSTMSIAGGGAGIGDLPGMDNAVKALAASDFTDPLGTSAGDPGGTVQLGQWNSTGLRLATRPGGNAATCIMATLRNDSGTALNGFDLSFTLLGGEDAELPGYVLYCSLTGEPDSWQQIGSFSTLGTVTASNIPLSTPWASGATLYVLWVDDNGNGVTDNWYGFDDVTFAKSGGSADPFTTWINTNYPTLSNKEPGGDPDGDDVTNQAEFAFGLNPSLGSSCNPIVQQLNKSSGLFKYTRRLNTGLAYTYEWSATLTGTWSTFTPDSATSNSGTPVEEITVKVPSALLLANPKFFVRVKAL
jgi:hypothetical protein